MCSIEVAMNRACNRWKVVLPWLSKRPQTTLAA
jgi:hypothetical protein